MDAERTLKSTTKLRVEKHALMYTYNKNVKGVYIDMNS